MWALLTEDIDTSIEIKEIPGPIERPIERQEIKIASPKRSISRETIYPSPLSTPSSRRGDTIYDASRSQSYEIQLENNDICSICTNKKSLLLDIHTTKCGHKFHNKCFEEYKNHNKSRILTCPLCRIEL